MSTSLVAHKPAPQEALRIVDDVARRAITTDVDRDGQIAHSLRGNKRTNETGDLEVCRILLDRLNQDGEPWKDLIQLKAESRAEAGVDCQASHGIHILDIQVTRALSDPDFWKRVNPHVPSNLELSNLDCAEQLRVTIANKAAKPKGGIVLALDSIETPHCTQHVIELFRSAHGAWARSLGYKSIWVVGPTADLTFQLDVEE